MPRQRTGLPQTRRHVWIFDQDWEYLEANFGAQSAKPIGTSRTVRTLIHNWVNGQKAKAQALIDASAQGANTETKVNGQ